MQKNRLEAFSDGVIAIIITIMVLELKVPHGVELAALKPLLPVFLSYVLSFIYVGIYWNNHHHLLHTTQHVSGGIMWANLHLAFLAVAHPIRDRLDGRKPFRCPTHISLRCRIADGRVRLLDSATRHHRATRPRLSAGRSDRQRLEGKAFHPLLLDRHRTGVCEPMAERRAVCVRSRYVAHP